MLQEVSELKFTCAICCTSKTGRLISTTQSPIDNQMVAKTIMELDCGHIMEMVITTYRPQDKIIEV